MSDYNTSLPIAGDLKSILLQNAATDTYYVGMPMAYGAVPTAAGPVAGNGTCTALSADSKAALGDWEFDFSAALVADLKDPDGVTVGTYALTTGTGSVTVIEYKGLRFSITVGSAAFTASSIFTITVDAGSYAYSADKIEVIALQNKVLASEGSLLVGISGLEFLEAKLVNGSNATLAIDVAIRADALSNGIILR